MDSALFCVGRLLGPNCQIEVELVESGGAGLAAAGAGQHVDPIRKWAYFTTAIAKRHAQRVALTEKAKSAGETKQTPILTERELLVRTAMWINSGSYVPPSAVSTSKRAALLAAGLVTEATLRARQIY